MDVIFFDNCIRLAVLKESLGNFPHTKGIREKFSDDFLLMAIFHFPILAIGKVQNYHYVENI